MEYQNPDQKQGDGQSNITGQGSCTHLPAAAIDQDPSSFQENDNGSQKKVGDSQIPSPPTDPW